MNDFVKLLAKNWKALTAAAVGLLAFGLTMAFAAPVIPVIAAITVLGVAPFAFLAALPSLAALFTVSVLSSLAAMFTVGSVFVTNKAINGVDKAVDKVVNKAPVSEESGDQFNDADELGPETKIAEVNDTAEVKNTSCSSYVTMLINRLSPSKKPAQPAQPAKPAQNTPDKLTDESEDDGKEKKKGQDQDQGEGQRLGI